MGIKSMSWFLFLILSCSVTSLSVAPRQFDVDVHKDATQEDDRSASANFISTLQTMVSTDLVSRPDYRQRRFEESELFWKFYIQPKDLESLLDPGKDQGRATRRARILSRYFGRMKSRRGTGDRRRLRRSSPTAPDPKAPAVLYLPLGGGGVNECIPAAGSKLVQLVPLMFAGMTFTIFDAVANINNNINSNNNNNNNQNINFQQSVNTVVTGNVNVANQINVMNVLGRRRKRDCNNNNNNNIVDGDYARTTKKESWKELKKRAAKIARTGLERFLP